MPERIIIVLDRQGLWDIAVQEYGSSEGVFLLLQDNPELGNLDAVLTAGQKLRIRSAAIDQVVVDWYASRASKPVTGPFFFPGPCAFYLLEPPRVPVDYACVAEDFDAFESLLPEGAKVFIIDRLEFGPPSGTFGDDHIGHILTKGPSEWTFEIPEAGTVIEDLSLLAGEPYQYLWQVYNAFGYPGGRIGLQWLMGWTGYPGPGAETWRITLISAYTGYDALTDLLSPCRKPQLQYQVDGDWINIPSDFEPPGWEGSGFWVATANYERNGPARVVWMVGEHIQGYSSITPL
ncbi:MAG: hypothetical protein ABI432_09000 [Flavobacteriales bacterium]